MIPYMRKSVSFSRFTLIIFSEDEKSRVFLGFIVTSNDTKIDLVKVKVIQTFSGPKTVFDKGGPALTSCCRCLITGFAAIARPISEILKGEDGTVSNHRSGNSPVKFTEAQ